MAQYDLGNRLLKFSVSIINLSESFPNKYTGRYLSNQLLRSGVSPSLNYSEAQSAESKADFVHKMRLCLKELRETQTSLQIVLMSKLKPPTDVQEVLAECSELVAIFTASIETLRKKK